MLSVLSDMLGNMRKRYLIISLPLDLAVEVQGAAEEDGQRMSAWLTDAARRRLKARGLRQVVAEWEAIHGPFTEEELATARKRLGK